MKTVYLDNNATTMVAPEVRDVMIPFFGDLYGNPSSMHAFGGEVAKYVTRSREEVARFLNCDPEEVYFTSCATESDNTAVRGTADWYGKELKVITSAVEHPAILQPCNRLKAAGHEIAQIGVDKKGNLDLAALEHELSCAKGPKLVSIMWANNETGVVFPVEKISGLCKRYGAVFHTDAVQAYGHEKIDVNELKNRNEDYKRIAKEYQKSKDITSTRLYIETIEEMDGLDEYQEEFVDLLEMLISHRR